MEMIEMWYIVHDRDVHIWNQLPTILHSRTSLYVNDDCITSYDRDITVNIDVGAYTTSTVYDRGFGGNTIGYLIDQLTN